MAKKEIQVNYDRNSSGSANIDVITQLANKWVEGEALSAEEIESLVRQMIISTIDYYKCETYGEDLPKFFFSDELGDSMNGEFLPQNNEIHFNVKNFWNNINSFEGDGFDLKTGREARKDNLALKWYNGLASVMNTVAHEITHFFQNALRNALDRGEQLTESEEAKAVKLQLDTALLGGKVARLGQEEKKEDQKKEIEQFLKIAPYFTSQWEMLTEDPDLVETISFGYYLNNFEEADARKSGGIIAKDVIEKIKKNPNATARTLEWAEESINMAEEQPLLWGDKVDNSSVYNQIDKLESGIRDIDEFFAYVVDLEKNNSDMQHAFTYAKQFFLKDRSLKELVQIYKNTIYHALSYFEYDVWSEIKKTATPEELQQVKDEMKQHLRCGSIVETDFSKLPGENDKLLKESYRCIGFLDVSETFEIFLDLIKDDKILFACELIDGQFLPDITNPIDLFFAKSMPLNEYKKLIEEPQRQTKLKIDEYFQNQATRPLLEKDALKQISEILGLEEYFTAVEKENPVSEKELKEKENIALRESDFVTKYGLRNYVTVLKDKHAFNRASETAESVSREAFTLVTDEKVDSLLALRNERVRNKNEKNRIKEEGEMLDLNDYERQRRVQQKIDDEQREIQSIPADTRNHIENKIVESLSERNLNKKIEIEWVGDKNRNRGKFNGEKVESFSADWLTRPIYLCVQEENDDTVKIFWTLQKENLIDTEMGAEDEAGVY